MSIDFTDPGLNTFGDYIPGSSYIVYPLFQ